MFKFLLFTFFIYQITCTKVLLITADLSTPNKNDVQKKLSAFFETVDIFDAYTNPSPGLSLLEQYDATLVFRNYGWNNPTALGNDLANYVNAGYGVVLADFALTSDFPLLGGNFTSDYYVLTPGSVTSGVREFLVPVQSNHPILNNFHIFDGGSSSYHATASLSQGATLIASWTDSYPFIATKMVNGYKRVDLNFYPPSSDVTSGLWNSSTDGALLMANSIKWIIDSCSKYSDCLDCTDQGCQWCLTTGVCSQKNFTCTDRVNNPNFCPISCSFSTCDSCLNPSLNEVCSWCLDSSTCVFTSGDTCDSSIIHEKYCPAAKHFFQLN